MLKFNGEDGFPHSEICGSKVAHTSPQLIAACHVLHRLCMPRHPPIALTSRLRIHTTNDNFGTRIVGVPSACSKVLRALKCHSSQPHFWSHSQLDNLVVIGMDLPKETLPPRHRFLEPIHNVKEGRNAPLSAAMPRNFRLHTWSICREAHCPASPRLRRASCIARLGERRRMVEPIGIEPMTSSLQS